jgi:hypothetical protein
MDTIFYCSLVLAFCVLVLPFMILTWLVAIVVGFPFYAFIWAYCFFSDFFYKPGPSGPTTREVQHGATR